MSRAGANLEGSVPAPVAPGRREQRKESTRRELISAGRRLFGDRGLYDARIEDLTTLAGIAKGTIYGYFASKEELILAVEVAGLEELLRHVGGRVVGARSRRERVRRMAEAHFEFFEENLDLVKLFHQVRGMLKFERKEWQPLRRGLEKYVADLARLLEGDEARQREPGPRDLEAAEMLFGAVSGITSLGIALGRRRSPRSTRIVQAVTALVLSGESPRLEGKAGPGD